MQAFRRSRFLRHVALPLTLMAWLSGCYKWTRPAMPLEQALSERGGGRVLLTLSDGSLLRLESLSVRGDSLAGKTPVGDSRTVAFNDVSGYSMQEVDGLRTTLLVPALALTVGFIVALASFNSSFGQQ